MKIILVFLLTIMFFTSCTVSATTTISLPQINDTDIVVPVVTVTSNNQNFTTIPDLEYPINGIMYATKVVSSRELRITDLGTTLFNDSDYKIRVYQMEIVNDSGGIQYAVTETGQIKSGSLGYYNDCDMLMEVWGSGDLYPNHSLSISCSLFETVNLRDVQDWAAVWHYFDENNLKKTLYVHFCVLI